MTIGQKLRALRTHNKLTQERLGEWCGVSKGMVSQWEHDISIPPIDRILLLKKKIYFRLDWFYCEETAYRPELETLLKTAESLPDYAVTKLAEAGTSYAELIKTTRELNEN